MFAFAPLFNILYKFMCRKISTPYFILSEPSFSRSINLATRTDSSPVKIIARKWGQPPFILE